MLTLPSSPLLEKIDPTFSRGGTRSATKLLGFLGFCGGFMLAYQRSSCKPPFPHPHPHPTASTN
jgi:hypothetical protein